MKERKKEKERTRSGAGQTDHRPWRYFAVMGFLAPFVEQRDTTGNYCHGGGNRSPASQSADTATLDPGPEEIETAEDEAEAAWNVQLTPQVPPRPPSVVPGTSSTPPGPPRKRGRGRR